MLTLDGSTLEGGGQLVRVALSISAIEGIPVRITHIRANRASKRYPRSSHAGRQHREEQQQQKKTVEASLARGCLFLPRHASGSGDDGDGAAKTKKPAAAAVGGGLKESHLAALEWLAGKCGADVQGGEPYCHHHYQHQQPIPRKDGQKNGIPEDNGPENENENENENTPHKSCRFHLSPFHMQTRDTITQITMTIISGSSQTHALLESQLASSLRAIPCFSAPSLPITLHKSSGPASGDERRLYVLLVAHTVAGYRLGRDHLGSGRKIGTEADRRRLVSEVVGRLVREFVEECKPTRRECSEERHSASTHTPVSISSMDEFAEDQLVIFQALAEGRTSVHAHGGGVGTMSRGNGRSSLHTRTVRWVCQQMMGTVFDEMGGCEGRRPSGRRQAQDDNMDRSRRMRPDQGTPGQHHPEW
ncbi:hypothetical protein A1O1_06442 [Capronia coronata CBS 617.96]|uniref:RNA 3'-terminal phosphate cyclase domain-containing protein n=1 Tax=Capronia coronata CBS 617.96 TaxID=1182541 RepID=W9Y0R0_9EURO|nr:uncharacterized protein A1O1_06442 [Capronia coronata CBS 617.96]EXJ86073.1 hypothetical protein A1O1_06442 [Capronia coronata CBS 617.96]